MGRNLTSISLMAYLEYSFDIEDGVSNSKSIKQYGSSYSLPDLEQHESSYNLLTLWDPGEKPLQPPLFRKAIATKHHTQVSIIYTHTHTHTIILYISTYYTCQHKSLPHPPQEGSNRSLAYCTLLGVDGRYGRCAMPGSPMGWSEGLSWQ